MIFSDGFNLTWRGSFLKRVFDLIIGTTLLIVTLPVSAIAAMAIKLDSPGPILYQQKRVGANGRVFSILKFRSMRQDAEKDGVAVWAKTADPRITAVGQFLRRTRIDEIPQVFNVLSGEMSFVGPRPERPEFVTTLNKKIPFYNIRHQMKPGITGWAQIGYPYGASDEDAKAKLALDLYYVKNWNLFLDLVILLQTVRVVLWRFGAR
jgi:exopolysaccharide biosynthesis polyprenyl glycosylphosphotransferase